MQHALWRSSSNTESTYIKDTEKSSAAHFCDINMILLHSVEQHPDVFCVRNGEPDEFIPPLGGDRMAAAPAG